MAQDEGGGISVDVPSAPVEAPAPEPAPSWTTEVPSEVPRSESETPASSSDSPAAPEPTPSWTPEVPSEVSQPESESSSSDSSPSWTPEVYSDVPQAPTSEITLIDTGDIIVPTIDGEITAEAEEIISVFSNNDVFVEIEVIFTELEDEAEQEIQNEPTLADNTDEDPNVDLIDPSIIPDPPGPLPEPNTELPPEDTTPVPESPEASQSTIALLESLLEPEQLSVRRYEKNIILDETATHTCRADIFRADLQNETSSRARVTLFQNKKKNLPSFLEIGALPVGIDVVFKSNKDYAYAPGNRETVIEFAITRQVGALEWDFTIPIIYTLQDGEKSSSVVCQINILND